MKKVLKILLIVLILVLIVFALTKCEKKEEVENERASYTLKINISGNGQLAHAEYGNELKYDEEYPVQSVMTTIKANTKLEIEAKSDEGWKFVKWTKNGKDYSTDYNLIYKVTDNTELIAVFEQE